MNYIKVKDVFLFLKKSKIKAGDGMEFGTYPLFTSSNSLSKYINYYEIEDEAVIFGTGGNASINYCEGKFSISTDCYAIQPINKDTVLNKYIYYFFLSNFGILEAGFRGAGLKHISKEYIGNIIVPLPPIETQKKIAEILDKAQELTDKRKEQIALLDDFIQSVFIDMFGDSANNSKEWTQLKFHQITINHDSKRLPIKDADRTDIKGEYPYYGATGVFDHINKYIFNGDYLLVAEDGKNLINRKKPIAFRASGKFWVNNHAHVISSDDNINLTYLEYYLENIDISRYITGIDQFKLNKGNLEQINVNVPPLSYQNKFAQIVEKTEHLRGLLEKSLNEMENNFNSIMQRAFKGELF